jgi:NAD(P)H-dependent FMN reductase
VLGIAARRGDAAFEIVDIADFDLPLLDEAFPPSMGQYAQPHTHAWAAKIADFDAFVFVTPEYNHSMSGSLKNAIDFLFREWNDKAAGFVSYGSVGGARAVEQLRLVMGEIKVADVRAQCALSLFTDFENFTTFKPQPSQEPAVEAMLNDLIPWGRALQAMRLETSERGLL